MDQYEHYTIQLICFIPLLFFFMFRHRATHTGEDMHECDICHKKYAIAATLKSHKMVTHFGIKPYTCRIVLRKRHRKKNAIVKIAIVKNAFIKNIIII